MKKSILILSTLISVSCAKLAKEPRKLTPEEINAQYETKFGYVAFYEQTGTKFIEVQNGRYINEHRPGAGKLNCDSIESYSKHMLAEGVHTYSVFSTYISPTFYRVKDKLLYTGEANVIYDQCQVIKIQ